MAKLGNYLANGFDSCNLTLLLISSCSSRVKLFFRPQPMFYIQKMLLRARFNSKLINGFIKKATHITNRENVVYITAIMIVWMCLDAACVPTTLQHLYVAR